MAQKSKDARKSFAANRGAAAEAARLLPGSTCRPIADRARGGRVHPPGRGRGPCRLDLSARGGARRQPGALYEGATVGCRTGRAAASSGSTSRRATERRGATSLLLDQTVDRAFLGGDVEAMGVVFAEGGRGTGPRGRACGRRVARSRWGVRARELALAVVAVDVAADTGRSDCGS